MTKKKGRTKTKFRYEYASWFIANVLLCLITVGATFGASDKTSGFSSLLAYYFTATAIVVCFSFHHALTNNTALDRDESDLGKTKLLIITGFALAVIAIVFYFEYILDKRVSTVVNDWIFIIIPITAILYLGIDFWLAKPQIHRQALELEEASISRNCTKALTTYTLA